MQMEIDSSKEQLKQAESEARRSVFFRRSMNTLTLVIRIRFSIADIVIWYAASILY
ncbi:hypothetical protein RE628_21435 [Paenibacillus sp. D2_2]|uniref:hypothetical protein n=1 Tax=Paenibacillus sp. D2_2 TaxID=3073092 RepID=UPI002815D545|nr:hypothetical protein [Paenibacillus sp. D2_2]WMT39893.1 hypothetical protein RE628_21435 [Paenibacillus sp. D2_2]